MIALAVLAIAAFGSGAVAAGFPERTADRIDAVLRASLAIALGVGAWSSAYATSLLLTGRSGAVADVLLLLAGLALWLAAPRASGTPSPVERVPRWLLAFFVAACLAAAAGFVEHTWRFPDGGWDAWMIWNLRARFLVRATDFRTAFSPDLLFWAHPDYPWLLPGAVAHGFALLGHEATLVPEGVAALFGVLLVALVTAGMARLRGARWGMLAGLAVLTFPVFATFASNQQADVPLALYFAAAVVLIALACERPDRPLRLFALAGFLAGLGLWTKNEGALYAACLAAAIAFRLRDVRPLAAFCLGALPCAALLALFKLGLSPPNDLAHFSTPATLLANALDPRRWAELAFQTVRRIVFFQSFGLWLVAEVLAVALWARKSPATVAGTAVLLATAAYVPIYVLQPHALQWIFRTSIDRIILQLWPAAILATVLALVQAPATVRT